MRWVPIPGIGVPTHSVPLLDPNQNWVAYLDRKILSGRLYEGVRDPEGLLSDIPAMGTILFGVLTGIWLRRPKSLSAKAAGLLVAFDQRIGAGKCMERVVPHQQEALDQLLCAVRRRLHIVAACHSVSTRWRSSSGRAAGRFRGWSSDPTPLPRMFSRNFCPPGFRPFACMTAPGSLDLQQYIYQHWFFPVINPSFGSLLYAIAFVLVCFVPVVLLYRKKIFIKI